MPSLECVVRRLLVLGALAFAAGCSRDGATAPPPTPPPAAVATTQPQAMVRLTIRVVDLRNHAGDLVFGLFPAADGFPAEQSKALCWQVKPAAGDGTFTVDVPPGTYAASVLHDENRNGHIDKNLLGIPTEGYGVTNNPKPRRRAATFPEARFTLPSDGATLSISVQYNFL